MFGITYWVFESGIVYLLLGVSLIFYILVIHAEILKYRSTMKLFFVHLHEGYMIYTEDDNAPHLLSVFFGMNLNKVTYKSFYKNALKYMRSNYCLLINFKNKEVCNTRLGFTQSGRNRITFYAINPDGNYLSKFAVKSNDYCNEDFVEWFDKVVRLGMKKEESEKTE